MKKFFIWLTVVLLVSLIGVGGYHYYKFITMKPVANREKLELDTTSSYANIMSELKNDTTEYAWTVYINPVYGGNDRGNAAGDVDEADIVLAVAKYVKLMNQDKDVRIVLARDADTEPSVEQRMEILTLADPDMLIELRVGADNITKSMGVEVYYDDSYYDYKLTNATFADVLCRDIVTRTEGVAKGIFVDTNDEYGLLGLLKKPSAVVLCGNIDNQEERMALSSDAYRANMALGILDAIEECRSCYE